MIETLGLSNYTSSQQQNRDCVQLHFGEGEREQSRQMVYTIFPGITVQTSFLRTDRLACDFKYADKTISIDYCLSGKVEWETKNEVFCSMGPGEIRISSQGAWEGDYHFPTGSYQGVTVTLQVEEARKSLEGLQPWFFVDPEAILKQVDLRKRDVVVTADQGLNHIFQVMMMLCNRGDMSGVRIQVLEILLMLPPRIGQLTQESERPYFPKSVVDKVRAIKEELCEDMNAHRSLTELAEAYQISETMLKRCFRMMYGNSVYAFVKNHRLQTAAHALAETNRPIMEIALETGYENPSKFSAAFRKCYGRSPREYRNEARNS